MDFRTLIAIGLMVLVYFIFIVPSSSPPPSESTQTEESQIEAPVEPEARLKKREEAKVPTNPLQEQSIQFENDRLLIRLNALGELQSLELKNYFASPDSEERVAWDFGSRSFNTQRLWVNDEALNWSLSEQGDNRLVLTASKGNLEVEREIFLEDGSYTLQFEDRVTNKAQSRAEVDLDLVVRQEILKEKKVEGFQRFFSFFVPPADYQQSVWLENGNLKKDFLSNLSQDESKTSTKDLGWSGFSSKYFFLGAVPKNASIRELEEVRVSEDWVENRLELFRKQALPGETAEYSYSYYLGPKKLDELNQEGFELGKVIDFGSWIGPISRLLLNLMIFFHSLIPNYGVAIILLTITVKLILFPLAYKSAFSMRKLAIVQPKMKEIRDKFKKDPQRMQSEMMALYRKEKVNPIGGCLPILLQLPIFFALYRVFYESFEVRHASFLFWIQDLSARDPYFVIPILMTALMYFQQKIMPMPTTGEDNEMVRVQKAMFKWLPVMFGLMMLFFPAGLTLYFLSNAAISIGQQYFINKRLDRLLPRPNEVAVPASSGAQ